jgi:HD-GYP domain-containing protein (c-di-GMP phosphodiesterase class II)
MDAISVVKTISKIVEIRDPLTAGHQNRVAELAQHIAEMMNMPEDRILAIYISGLIHDLGMMAVPSDIICKSDRLNALELELIKMHPQTGFDILSDLDFYLPVTKIILQHHERVNGSGYPKGLKTGDTLIESRILAVADTLDAMTSHRAYRPAFGLDKAVEEITLNKEILFDPEVVEASLEFLSQKLRSDLQPIH